MNSRIIQIVLNVMNLLLGIKTINSVFMSVAYSWEVNSALIQKHFVSALLTTIGIVIIIHVVKVLIGIEIILSVLFSFIVIVSCANHALQDNTVMIPKQIVFMMSLNSIVTNAQETITAMLITVDVSHALKIKTGIILNVCNVDKTSIGMGIIQNVLMILSIVTHVQEIKTAMLITVDVSHALKINTGIIQSVQNVMKNIFGVPTIMSVFSIVAYAQEAKSALEEIQNVSVLLILIGMVINVSVETVLIGMKIIMNV